MPDLGETLDICPAERLETFDDAPTDYSPAGMIIGSVLGDTLWTIDPATGERGPNETVPQCTSGVNCQFSPDRQWILASVPNDTYLIRPDGTGNRRLFGSDDPNEYVYIPEMTWFGANTIEYWVRVEVQRNGRSVWVDALQRDIIGVFPDPDPWIPFASVNELPTEIMASQPGGPLGVVRTRFSTGVGPGYKYYIYDLDTGDSEYFARTGPNGLFLYWAPLGDRLVYSYDISARRPVFYQYTVEDGHRLLGDFTSGVMSNDGRYYAYATERRAQPVAVWDSHTGLTRTYCLPETGARLYEGPFIWAPDSQYLALNALLPKDQDEEGVGQHLMILNLETGQIMDLSTGFTNLVVWARDPGTYGDGD